MEKVDWEEFVGLNDTEIDRKAEEILSMMTLDEKIKQMQGDRSFILGTLSMLRKYNAKPILAGACKRLSIPAIGFSDGPRGIVMGNSTCFPVSIARGASWDVELEERIGNAIAIEARAQGANFFGGVCINLLRHPAWGRAQETYGEDPFHLGMMGSALIRGVQKQKVMACAKHYAANSIENSRFKVNVTFDSDRTLREIYLPHFKRCVEEGVASIMTAYNKVNGEYCGHNSYLIREILKKDWAFKGFVISDFTFGIRDGEAAIKGGMDIEMPYKWHMNPKKIEKLVKKGKIQEKLIDEAVLRILRMKIKFSSKNNVNNYKLEKVACEEHTKLALEAALKSIVLLKNENNILPLNKTVLKKMAVIGKLANVPNIGDTGSSRVYPPHIITAYDGIRNSAGKNIEVIYDKGENINSAIETAKDVEVVIIVVGLTKKDEGEYIFSKGGDRDSLELKPHDRDLISKITASNKNTIVILEGGSAFIIESWKYKVPAILMAWYPGMEGGNAIGKVVFGEFNPCGKLPIIFPKSEKQLPYFNKNTKAIQYGYYHGYRLIEKNEDKPAFPFGFGLSYTNFSYDNLQINDEFNKNENIVVSVEVTNTGTQEGEEIVQIYVGYKNPSVDRPKKDLKGFGKLFLKPGETKTFKSEIKSSSLAYYNVKTGSWDLELGEYIIYVGGSSRMEDLLLKTFKITDSSQ